MSGSGGFLKSVQTGLSENGESRWADEILYNGYATGKSFCRIAQADSTARITFPAID
jgi:hypothetical protein